MTYTELKTAVKNWLHREDLDSIIPDFITQGEGLLNRRLRLTSMLNRESLTAPTSDRYIDLPSGFLEAVELKNVDTEPAYNIKYCTPREIINHYPSDLTTTQRPYWFTIKDKIELNCKSDDNYSLELLYYKKLDIATDSSNWLSTNYPDVYIYAALINANIYIGNSDKILLFETKLDKLISEINTQEFRKRGEYKTRVAVDSALTVNSSTFDIVSGQ